MTTKRALALLPTLAILVGACAPPPVGVPLPSPAGATEAPRATPTPAPTPTPTPKPVYWPLTGVLVDGDPNVIKRRPLNVRLPNDSAARPQVGLAKADLVFEFIVEGGITRYSAIYHSQSTTNVGPVRSYRWSDLHLTQLLRGALVASGATVEETDAVTNSIAAGNMVSVDAVRRGDPYYRVGNRPAPNNMFANLDIAREAVNAVGGSGPVDVPPLKFFPSLDHEATGGGFAGSVEATTVTVPFQRDPVTFTWDEGSKGYRRSQAGVRTVDPEGNVPMLARNVVVMHTNIWLTTVVEDLYGSLGLDYRMTGDGAASIFRDGRRQDGTWRRDGPLDQFAFFDKTGQPISLNPGQTWVHFVYPEWVITSTP